jgi:quercetin dioxygenase-like cupin family protein
MKHGWLIGGFDPAVLKTNQFEVGLKKYSAGDRESSHHHKVAQEITVIVQGRAKMMGQVFTSGDIIVLEPNESTTFEALEDTVTLVVKTPSVAGDKYLD